MAAPTMVAQGQPSRKTRASVPAAYATRVPLAVRQLRVARTTSVTAPRMQRPEGDETSRVVSALIANVRGGGESSRGLCEHGGRLAG
jgi:hypothetical protein